MCVHADNDDDWLTIHWFTGIFFLITWLACYHLQWKAWHLWLHCKFTFSWASLCYFPVLIFPKLISFFLTFSVIGTCKIINCLGHLMSCRISLWKTCNSSHDLIALDPLFYLFVQIFFLGEKKLFVQIIECIPVFSYLLV